MESTDMKKKAKNCIEKMVEKYYRCNWKWKFSTHMLTDSFIIFTAFTSVSPFTPHSTSHWRPALNDDKYPQKREMCSWSEGSEVYLPSSQISWKGLNQTCLLASLTPRLLGFLPFKGLFLRTWPKIIHNSDKFNGLLFLLKYGDLPVRKKYLK